MGARGLRNCKIMKRLALISALVLLTALLFGCGEHSAEITSEEAIASSPESERVLGTEPQATALVPNPEWGFPVHSVRSLDETVVTAKLDQLIYL